MLSERLKVTPFSVLLWHHWSAQCCFFLFIVPLCPVLFGDLKIKLISVLEHKLQGGFIVKFQRDSQRLQIHFWGRAGCVIFACCLSPGWLWAGPAATQCKELRNGRAVRHPGRGWAAMSLGEMANITGRIWAGSRGGWGTKRPATIKYPFMSMAQGTESSAKSHSPAGGNKFQMSQRQTGARAKSWNGTISHRSPAQLAARGCCCGKVPSCPLKEWHHLNFLSQKQVLLGAVEIVLPGFLWLSILWLIIRG